LNQKKKTNTLRYEFYAFDELRNFVFVKCEIVEAMNFFISIAERVFMLMWQCDQLLFLGRKEVYEYCFFS